MKILAKTQGGRMGNEDAGGTRRDDSVIGWEILLTGRVQGVGMRPAVWRLAQHHRLKGWVRNEGAGVRIRLWGSRDAIAALRKALLQWPPLSAVIEGVEEKPLVSPSPRGFSIKPSRNVAVSNSVPSDRAVCRDCVADVFDPSNRRYRYPFTHCARCGPRFTLIERLPYDRNNTSLRTFPLCAHCRKEYEDPTDRRFHAEAIACPECGPRLWTHPETSQDPIEQVKVWLRQGRIVAIKGVGGFHLVTDATHTEAVERLRARKHRPHKPLALMARDVEVIQRYCRLSVMERWTLQSAERPIVLLQQEEPDHLPAAIAPELDHYGFMLPYTPLHHLLLQDFAAPLVFTSANPSGAPLCVDNTEAMENLHGIADAWLLHDREILHRCDDAVVRLAAGRMQVLRSGRGYAPVSLPLPEGLEKAEGILALGGELKNTFCLVHQGRAIMSQHLGDLEDARTFAWYREETSVLQRLFGFTPQHLAIDRHPDYHATQYGQGWAGQQALRLTEVQHHHAHLAACLAERAYPLAADPVLGLILDGLGYGDDGTFWGGELLLADYRSFRRLAHLRPAPLPGGSKAMTEPWRNLVARLWQAQIDPSAFSSLTGKPVKGLLRMLDKEINSPLASSSGRLFDAVAAALGICVDQQSFEGQAAGVLEALAWKSDDRGAYPFGIKESMVDPYSMWPRLLEDLSSGVPRETIARRFHLGLTLAWTQLIGHFGRSIDCHTVVLSGGVLQNRLLLETLHDSLRAMDFNVWIPEKIPMNDGGLSLGQAVVAAANS